MPIMGRLFGQRGVVTVFLIIGGALPLFAQPPAPDTEREAFQRALASFNAKAYLESVRQFEALATQHPTNGLYWFNAGNAAFMLEDYPAALRAYQHVIEVRSPLSPAARLYAAKTFRKLARIDKAEKILRQLQQKDLPENLKKAVADETALVQSTAEIAAELLPEAVDSYEAGHFEDAVGLLDYSLKAAETADAHLMMSLVLLQVERPRPDEAVRHARRALELDRDNPQVQATTQDLFRLIRSKKYRKRPLWLFVDLSGGYNSNIFLDGGSEGKAAQPSIETLLGFGYRFRPPTPWRASIGYHGTWDEGLGAAESRYFGHTLEGSLSFEPRGWVAEISPLLEYQHLGTEPFLLKTGGSLDFQKLWESFDAGVDYRLKRNVALSSTYDYLNGFSHRLRLKAGFSTPHLYWLLTYNLLFEQIGDFETASGTLPLHYFGHGPTSTVYWEPLRRSKLSLTAGYLWKDYSADRQDRQFSASARAGVMVLWNLELYASLSVTQNSSTLEAGDVDDKNYVQVVGLGGLSWDILP